MDVPRKYRASATARQIHPVRSAPRAVWRTVAAAIMTLARAAGTSDISPT